MKDTQSLANLQLDCGNTYVSLISHKAYQLKGGHLIERNESEYAEDPVYTNWCNSHPKIPAQSGIEGPIQPL